MDFQAFADCCAMPCAVFSVELTADSRCGDIRIVCGNQAYRDLMGPAFHDGMLYHELVPKEAKFEDFCFRSAIMGQRLRAYVEVEGGDHWIDETLVPLKRIGDTGYFQFLLEFTESPDPARMANVSMDTATCAVKASITLMGTNDIRERAKTVLEDMIEQIEGFAGRIVLVDFEHHQASKFCEAFCRGFFPNVELDDVVIPFSTVESWERLFETTNIVIMKDEHDMAEVAKTAPEWIAELRPFNINSMVLIPLRRGAKTIGYLYLSNFNVDKVVEVKELVELMAFFLGAEISNYLLMEQLEIMGNHDGLTGVYNRHAMLNRMKEITALANPVPFGVINMDLNGLKAANDLHGHDAGDQLLVETAEILKKIFHEDDLFRTGGDEFIVITTDIERDVFERKVERLRSAVEKSPTVDIAIGAHWSDGSCDLRKAFVNADERMYADKAAFYESRPDLQRQKALVPSA